MGRKKEDTGAKDVDLGGGSGPGDGDDVWRWLTHGGIRPALTCVAVFAILVRAAVALHSYSGAGTPPKYGDFEAQRHWMEITVNLPPGEWYRNSSRNDLSYWGLDYPPLTAYQSYVHGLVLKFLDPSSVALFSSRGYETYLGKLLMRWTVLSSDVLVFFPAAFWFLSAYWVRGGRSRCEMAWHMAMVLFNPGLILIDHGHFQYNCISLGLTVGAVASILSQKDLIACVLFSLALNHKQMSAYFAPAFFCHLLGKSLQRNNPILEVLKLGIVVIGTFSIVWWPYLYSSDAILQVLSRLAPFERGIYEDYVANFWCATSILIKWKRLFTTPMLKVFSLTSTLSACLPSMIMQIYSPSSQGFLYALFNSSLSFYLFSFQVHEKSILLPLLPASLLAVDEPSLYKWFAYYALLSMFPLLLRDGLVLAYAALSGLFFLLHQTRWERRGARLAKSMTLYWISTKFSLCCGIGLHLVYLTVPPPEKYPFLFEALIMIFCFSHFVLLVAYAHKQQWALLKSSKSLKDSEKKSL
ncbi:hypothetical protein MLD38_001548 [Melastoma candidum]|uniref:Uncharacterized protein n=1 Tax=Melastoma candidum TaxID=119954 RepID=A0ACB9SCX1_9MYRT|nr:hypothetical protein MLD38_001548 [Melastoma candidum]